MATFTVTATQTAGTANGLLLRVKVLTGTAAVQNGATVSSATALNANITTTQAGSIVYGALEGDAAAGAFVAEPSCTLIDNFHDTTNVEYYGSFRTTSPTGTPGSTLVGSTTTNANRDMAAVEILPNGTIAEDASGPAAATTMTATAVTTASFTPPAGALLVAMIGSDGDASGTLTTFSVTDTSGLGLTWTQAVGISSASTCYAGVWLAQLPAAAAPPASVIASPSPSWRNRYHPKPRLQLTVPVFLPPVTTASVSDTDASGPETDAGESIAAALSDTDAGHGTDAGEALAVTLSSSDTGHGTDAGEALAVTLSSSDTGHGTDAGEGIALSSSDVSGPETDAGEGILALSAPAASFRPSPLWRARFRPPYRLQLPLFPGTFPGPADTDFSGPETDAGEALAVALSSSDAGHGTDAGEGTASALTSQDASGSDDEGTTVGLGAADAGHGADAGESIAVALSGSDTGHGTDAGEGIAAALSSSDAGHGTDAGEGTAAVLADTDASGPETDAGESEQRMDFALGQALVSQAWLTKFGRQRYPKQTQGVIYPVGPSLVIDADHGLGEDSEIDNPFPVEQDVSGQAADGGETVAAALNSKAFTSDTCQGTDYEQKSGAFDRDTGRGTDTEQVQAATMADSDGELAFDQESSQFGPNASISDSDAVAGQEQQIIDVYAYQPLFRFQGGGFRAPLRPRFPVPPPGVPAGLDVTAIPEAALSVSVEITRSGMDTAGS